MLLSSKRRLDGGEKGRDNLEILPFIANGKYIQHARRRPSQSWRGGIIGLCRSLSTLQPSTLGCLSNLLVIL